VVQISRAGGSRGEQPGVEFWPDRGDDDSWTGPMGEQVSNRVGGECVFALKELLDLIEPDDCVGEAEIRLDELV